MQPWSLIRGANKVNILFFNSWQSLRILVTPNVFICCSQFGDASWSTAPNDECHLTFIFWRTIPEFWKPCFWLFWPPDVFVWPFQGPCSLISIDLLLSLYARGLGCWLFLTVKPCFGLFWRKPAVLWLFPLNKVMTFKSTEALRESAAESQVTEWGCLWVQLASLNPLKLVRPFLVPWLSDSWILPNFNFISNSDSFPELQIYLSCRLLSTSWMSNKHFELISKIELLSFSSKSTYPPVFLANGAPFHTVAKDRNLGLAFCSCFSFISHILLFSKYSDFKI